MVTEVTPTFVDDVDLEELDTESSPIFVARLPRIAIEKRATRDGGLSKPLLHVAWEPLSFTQEFNRTAYPFRTDDYSHDWLTIFTRDGKVMGASMPYGQVKEAFEALDFKLTRNEVFRPLLEGKIFTVTRVREEYQQKDAEGKPAVDENGKPIMRRNFYIKPLELLENYTPPATPRKVRYGFKESGGVAAASVTAEQNEALKRALHGHSEDEYINAVLFGGEPLINCDPFVTEAGDAPTLTARAKALGGEDHGGRIFFKDLM